MRLATIALAFFANLVASANATPSHFWQFPKSGRGCKSTYLQWSIIAASLLSAGSSTAQAVGPRTISTAEAIVIDFIEICMTRGDRIDFSAQLGREYGMVDEADESLEELPSGYTQRALLKNDEGDIYLRTAFEGTGPVLCQLRTKAVDSDQRSIALGSGPINLLAG